MKLKQLKKLLDIDEKEIDINHMRILEDYFFQRSEDADYRHAAIDFCIRNKIPFHQTVNNNYEIISRFVKIKCPVCGNMMEAKHGRGNGDAFTVTFVCPQCKSEAKLETHQESLSFNNIGDKDEM